MDKDSILSELEDLYDELTLNYKEWSVPDTWLIALEEATAAVEELSDA